LAEKVVKGLVMTASWLKTRPPSLVHLWLCQNIPGHVFNRPRTTLGILSKLTPGWPCLIIEAKDILLIFFSFQIHLAPGWEKRKEEKERDPSSHVLCIVSFPSRRW
jgi:hypothetical protein